MPLPQLTISPQAVKRVRHYDSWVFREELVPGEPAPEDGSIVELIDPQGAFQAYAFYSGTSHIAARTLGIDKDEPFDRKVLAVRLRAAFRKREALAGTNAKRLFFSEADGVPGLIVDQYADFLVLQSRTAGVERFKPVIVELLQRELKPKGIFERSDKEYRQEEGLAPAAGVLAGEIPKTIRIEESGLSFLVDPRRGHKTGYYLDQRDTRRALWDRVRPGQRLADVFAYTGVFGIGAAARGAEAVCVEQDEGWSKLTLEQARLNGVEARVSSVAGNAFYWMEAKARAGERFDWVLLDPPSLAKSKSEIVKGRQALHHLLVNGLKITAPGGTLVLSICTYHLLGLVEEIMRIAAADVGVKLAVTAVTMQAADHPWILQVPATRYLMSWFVRREE